MPYVDRCDITLQVTVAANGEIYNFKEEYQKMSGTHEYEPTTGSDCEVIIPLYQQKYVSNDSPEGVEVWLYID
jgi:asparagine synthetase B (glutamine-hydrolysing)